MRGTTSPKNNRPSNGKIEESHQISLPGSYADDDEGDGHDTHYPVYFIILFPLAFALSYSPPSDQMRRIETRNLLGVRIRRMFEVTACGEENRGIRGKNRIKLGREENSR